MGLVLNIGRNVPADVRARSAAEIRQISSKIIKTRRGPPETQRVRVLAQLLARIKIVGFEQSLCALELFVREIVLVVEVCDFVVDGSDRLSRFVWCGLRDN